MSCSILEIYRENLYDLLNAEEKSKDLKIKEQTKKGIYVSGLTQYSLASKEEMHEVIKIGQGRRQTRETKLNEYSSRSHTIVTIEITQRLQNGAEKIGRLNLIDLAGSEKVKVSGAEGAGLEEAKKINLSLSCLGNCEI